jgi:hypothetical protein
MARKKKVKGKIKNITQSVVVNIGGRKKSSAPTQQRPTPLQQATQFIQATRPQQGDSLLQSTQILQRLIDPTNKRLDLLQEQIKSFPTRINLPFEPREKVLDQPDAQLVQPNQPLISAGPERMDNPHEDVPLSSVSLVSSDEEDEFVDEGKREAGQLDNETQQLLKDILQQTVESKKDFTTKPKIREVARELGVIVSKNATKTDIALLIARKYSQNPDAVVDVIRRLK